MIYQYVCQDCKQEFDVIKRASDMERPELCKCGAQATREFVPSKVFFNGTKVEHAEYNPGLGCIVRNTSHRKEIARSKGLEEIGNEKPETIHKHFDKAREERREKAWAEADKGWIGSGE